MNIKFCNENWDWIASMKKQSAANRISWESNSILIATNIEYDSKPPDDDELHKYLNDYFFNSSFYVTLIFA